MRENYLMNRLESTKEIVMSQKRNYKGKTKHQEVLLKRRMSSKQSTCKSKSNMTNCSKSIRKTN